MTSDIFSFISASTALIATIAGPYVAVKTARSQIKANLISTNRARWIESMRDLVACAISHWTGVMYLRKCGQSRCHYNCHEPGAIEPHRGRASDQQQNPAHAQSKRSGKPAANQNPRRRRFLPPFSGRSSHRRIASAQSISKKLCESVRRFLKSNGFALSWEIERVPEQVSFVAARRASFATKPAHR